MNIISKTTGSKSRRKFSYVLTVGEYEVDTLAIALGLASKNGKEFNLDSSTRRCAKSMRNALLEKTCGFEPCIAKYASIERLEHRMGKKFTPSFDPLIVPASPGEVGR